MWSRKKERGAQCIDYFSRRCSFADSNHSRCQETKTLFFFIFSSSFSSKKTAMTNKLFIICLLTGLLCAYCEYYWMRHGYRSLALVASKCPKPSVPAARISADVHQGNNQTRTDSIFDWFWNLLAATKDKPVAPVVCETFEIHTDPRSIFILIKTLCLIGLTLKLIASLKTVPTLIRARHAATKEPTFLSSISKGDGFVQQSKLFETSNGKVGLVTTSIDKRTSSVR